MSPNPASRAKLTPQLLKSNQVLLNLHGWEDTMGTDKEALIRQRRNTKGHGPSLMLWDTVVSNLAFSKRCGLKRGQKTKPKY